MNVSATAGHGLQGAFNFRDLGGQPAGAGHRVRRGVLFRSDTLQALTPADVDHLLDDIGLELVIDLRFGVEAVEEGRGRLAERAVSYLNAPLQDLPPAGPPGVAAALPFYLEHLSAPRTPLTTALRALSAMAGRPTLIHCAAGKDRTGLVAALVLRLLDVADDDIVADYLRTAANMPRVTARFREWPRYRDHMSRVAPQVYQAREETIRGFLAALDRDHGGARSWAASRGIEPAVVDRLREGLREPA